MDTRTPREQFLWTCLDDVAARVRVRRSGRRFDLASARRVLTDLISRDQGLVSFRLSPADTALMAAYFDRRADFERVSDNPEWQPRAMRRPAAKAHPAP